MDAQALQTLVAALIVASAAGFVLARGYRAFASMRKRKDDACGGGCDCSSGH